MNIFDKRKVQIAIETIKNPAKSLLGGPSLSEAIETLKRIGYTDEMILKLRGLT